MRVVTINKLNIELEMINMFGFFKPKQQQKQAISSNQMQRQIKPPVIARGYFNIYMNNNGYLVQEDVISSYYSEGRDYLPTLPYESIKQCVIIFVGGKLTKKNLKFAEDMANYIASVRGYK